MHGVAVALISVYLGLSQTPVHTAKPYRIVHCVVCLFTSFCWYLLHLPQRNGH